MGDRDEQRRWDEMIPDALGLIFGNLSLQEKLTVVPRVCKAWGKAVAGPYCWQDIDIEEWSQRCKPEPEHLDRMIRMLISRSCGSFRRLSVYGLSNDTIFSYIADHAGSLQTLELPRSEISDPIVQKVAARLCTVTFLDVSCCQKIGAAALEAFGKHCKSLVGLRRAMHPLEVLDMASQDDEAHAIATTMPKLQHLEVAYSLLTTAGILKILSGCKNLEFLDVRGCWDVNLDENFLKEKHADLKVLGPDIDDCYERMYWDDCSDDLDSSTYSWEFMEDASGMWDDEEALDGLEVRFYGGGFNESFAGFHLPSSP